MALARNSDSEEHLHSTFASRYVRAVIPRFLFLSLSVLMLDSFLISSVFYDCIIVFAHLETGSRCLTIPCPKTLLIK